MEAALKKKKTVEDLRNMILATEGYTPKNQENRRIKNLGRLEKAFPFYTFPEGVIHEFISEEVEQAAAATGFIGGLIGMLMQHEGPCVWVSLGKRLFPPSLVPYRIDPSRIIFIQLEKNKEALWALEESLKCNSLSAVVAEIKDLDLIASRRLQLAVEKSRVTCFIHRFRPKQLHSMAFTCRWRIRPEISYHQAIPGIGHPFWEVTLEKVRNGKPGCWQIGWFNGQFQYQRERTVGDENSLYKTGS